MDRFLRALEERSLEVMVVTAPSNTFYVGGFQAIVYTRPIVVVLCREPALIVPKLEEEHARDQSRIEDVRVYDDADFGRCSPMETALGLAVTVMTERGLAGKACGYEDASMTVAAFRCLSDAVGAEHLRPASGLVESLRRVKTAKEIERVRLGCTLSDWGMAREIDLSRPGATEIDVQWQGNAAMAAEARRRHPERRIHPGSRPVFGHKTAIPHAMPGGLALEARDVMIHGCGFTVDGYHSENERTLFLGKPTVEQARAYEAAHRAQREGVAAIRPGVACAHVDRLTREIIDEAGYGEYILHRTGHGIGIDPHEAPYFSLNDETPLEPGMILTVEPGIYIPGVGGFRHSDTVLVTEEGAKVLTSHPKWPA